MAFDVATLDAFNNETAGELVVKAIMGGSTIEYATVKEGLKSKYYLNEEKDLAFCGDYFEKANLEGSFLSAKALGDELI